MHNPLLHDGAVFLWKTEMPFTDRVDLWAVSGLPVECYILMIFLPREEQENNFSCSSSIWSRPYIVKTHFTSSFFIISLSFYLKSV
jgi:hypothetical protein